MGKHDSGEDTGRGTSFPDPLPALPKKFVRSALMLLLLEQPAHGYELLERLQQFRFRRPDPGGLYRNLRALEDAGLVQSTIQVFLRRYNEFVAVNNRPRPARGKRSGNAPRQSASS